MWYFYVLKSNHNDWFYRGSTNDLEKRLNQHNSGKVRSTKPYRPLQIVYYEAYVNEASARNRESKVKLSGSVWIPIQKRIKRSISL